MYLIGRIALKLLLGSVCVIYNTWLTEAKLAQEIQVLLVFLPVGRGNGASSRIAIRLGQT
jgi:hypothetical protein